MTSGSLKDRGKLWNWNGTFEHPLYGGSEVGYGDRTYDNRQLTIFSVYMVRRLKKNLDKKRRHSEIEVSGETHKSDLACKDFCITQKYPPLSTGKCHLRRHNNLAT